MLAELRPFAREIVGADDRHALAAAQRIQDHFQQHYTYSLHVNLDQSQDPIVDFVRHRRPAYCEYFASGMVLMLRALGIPARVAGGFVVWEYNALLQQWIVRQRDAHAWVEVYDDQSQRWVGFDATPPFRQETFSRTGLFGFFDQGRAWIELQFRTLMKRLYQIDFIGWLIRLRQVKTWLGPLGLGVMAVLLIGGAYGLCRRFYPSLYRFLKQLIKWPVRHRPAPAADPAQAEAQHHFAQVAALLKQRGVPILPTETLDDYLQRLQSPDICPADGPRWAQLEPSGQSPCIGADPAWIEAIANFSHAYHRLRFHPCPAVLEDQAARLNAIRRATNQIQQMQRDRAAAYPSNQ